MNDKKKFVVNKNRTWVARVQVQHSIHWATRANTVISCCITEYEKDPEFVKWHKHYAYKRNSLIPPHDWTVSW